MRWRGRRQSSNVEDRRGTRRVGKAKAGGIGGIGAIIVALIAMYFGVDPSAILGGLQNSGPARPQTQSAPRSAQEDEMAAMTKVVLADTEDIWPGLMASINQRYIAPTLVLFTDAVRSACGFAQAATGPFYCPADQKVYIDLGFFRDLSTRFKAPGDFAQAYVIAHEVGHHVQTLLGISRQVHQQKARMSKAEANQMSVRQELQADCFAGVWAHHTEKQKRILESGDIQEALGAATAIGDDRLQRQSRGYVSPESFTHGTSEQRVRWFSTGFRSGELSQCDTFGTNRL